YEHSHIIQKRVFPEVLTSIGDTNNHSNVQPPITSTISSVNNITENGIDQNIDNKKPLPPPPKEVKTIRNFGENGTGIWWNITTTTVKPQISMTSKITEAPIKTPPEKTNIDVVDHDHFLKGNFSITDKDDLLFPDDTISYNDTFLNKHNITSTKTDTHIYYNSALTVGEEYARQYWVDMTNRSDVKVHQLLSNSYRRASTIRLSFEFPYYGHPVRNITIATGGFLYTGVDIHSWLAATQYVAPLMANFDTSVHNDSHVKYLDNGTALTVEWEKVYLQDNTEGGQFTFQVTLVNNGDIIFVYKNVPLLVENIRDEKHPVKVGISDAYVRDRTLFMVRRKTIYEYHKVSFKKEDIKNWTVIHLTALPTCPTSKDCVSCLSESLASFKCSWCPKMNKCSNGYDRSRQTWLTMGCDKVQIVNESLCQSGSSSSAAEVYEDTLHDRDVSFVHASRSEALDGSVNIGLSGIMTIICMIAFSGGLGVWILYAYRNPHTTSGQMLIRYRPSQWRWRRGEARYTAATIHM
ncbi:plexin domain-containing protein 2, partial [Agrilus planipennis]|uniref:Plexin domain-containing protein 2 n=1 Tax=Agrilus planipennis TaxID=224129 RepID=A0A1W4XPM5_AGRPL